MDFAINTETKNPPGHTGSQQSGPPISNTSVCNDTVSLSLPEKSGENCTESAILKLLNKLNSIKADIEKIKEGKDELIKKFIDYSGRLIESDIQTNQDTSLLIDINDMILSKNRNFSCYFFLFKSFETRYNETSQLYDDLSNAIKFLESTEKNKISLEDKTNNDLINSPILALIMVLDSSDISFQHKKDLIKVIEFLIKSTIRKPNNLIPQDEEIDELLKQSSILALIAVLDSPKISTEIKKDLVTKIICSIEVTKSVKYDETFSNSNLNETKEEFTLPIEEMSKSLNFIKECLPEIQIEKDNFIEKLIFEVKNLGQNNQTSSTISKMSSGIDSFKKTLNEKEKLQQKQIDEIIELIQNQMDELLELRNNTYEMSDEFIHSSSKRLLPGKTQMDEKLYENTIINFYRDRKLIDEAAENIEGLKFATYLPDTPLKSIIVDLTSLEVNNALPCFP